MSGHGTYWSYVKGCRCVDCTEANRLRSRIQYVPTVSLWERPDWYDSAACVNEPTESFYPEQGCKNGRDRYARLRLICAGCPVRQECLDHAVKNERFGFWGGKTPKERLDIRMGRASVA